MHTSAPVPNSQCNLLDLATALEKEVLQVEGVKALLSPNKVSRLWPSDDQKIRIKSKTSYADKKEITVDIYLEVGSKQPTGEIGNHVQKVAGNLIERYLDPQVIFSVNIHILRIAL